jgi:PAS domain S-box-containing protein
MSEESWSDSERAKVVAALRESEARYSTIFERSPIGKALTRWSDRVTVSANPAFLGIVERTAEEVVGKAGIDLVIATADGQEQQTVLESGGAVRDLECVRISRSGTTRILSLNADWVFVNGEKHILTTVRDLTDLRWAERVARVLEQEHLSRLRGEIEQRLLSEIGRELASRVDEAVAFASLTRLTVLEFADVSTLFVAEDGRIERRGVACRSPANEWFTDLLMRLPVDRRRPHPVWEVLDTRRSLLLQIEAGDLDRHAVDEENRRALERLGARSVIAVPIVIGERAQGALLVASCKPSRAFDARDVALMEEIARRVALSLENARLYSLARKAVQARDEVLSIVAHDLRSPLGAILLQATLTRRMSGPERRSLRPAEAIERSVSQMKRMINDLLDVTQIESGRLELERAPVAPIDLLGEVVETHRELAGKRAIDLRWGAAPDLPRAWADQGRVVQVFDNLVGNAMRFSTQGTISLNAYPMGGEILFSVADTGFGIAADDLPHVFDRFWQASRAQRGGAGLGLAIVKGIVEAHGGRAWIESKLGTGTTVFFTIPVVPTTTPDPAGPEVFQGETEKAQA